MIDVFIILVYIIGDINNRDCLLQGFSLMGNFFFRAGQIGEEYLFMVFNPWSICLIITFD